MSTMTLSWILGGLALYCGADLVLGKTGPSRFLGGTIEWIIKQGAALMGATLRRSCALLFQLATVALAVVCLMNWVGINPFELAPQAVALAAPPVVLATPESSGAASGYFGGLAPPTRVPIQVSEISLPIERETGTRLSGVVVSSDKSQPLNNVRVSTADDSVRTDDRGAWELFLPYQPSLADPIFLTFTDTAHRSSVVRWSPDRQTIKLEPKARVLVVKFGGMLKDQPFASLAQDLRLQVENHLRKCREFDVMSSANFDRVLDEHYRVQRIGGLFERSTIAKLGQAQGATHVLIVDVSDAAGGMKLSAQLVDLESTGIEQAAQSEMTRAADVSETMSALVDKILSAQCEGDILWPRDNQLCPLQQVFSGSCQFLPASWELWIAVQPSSTELVYPQHPLKVDQAGMFRAPNVCIGNEEAASIGQEFSVQLLLVDPAVGCEMADYRKSIKRDPEANCGMDLTKCSGQCKVLKKINVVRANAISSDQVTSISR